PFILVSPAPSPLLPPLLPYATLFRSRPSINDRFSFTYLHHPLLNIQGRIKTEPLASSTKLNFGKCRIPFLALSLMPKILSDEFCITFAIKSGVIKTWLLICTLVLAKKEKA